MSVRLGVLAVSASTLSGRLGIEMRLDDGGGIGHVLVGTTVVDGVGSVAFECPWDPHVEICSVSADTEAADALDVVQATLGLGTAAVRELVIRVEEVPIPPSVAIDTASAPEPKGLIHVSVDGSSEDTRCGTRVSVGQPALSAELLELSSGAICEACLAAIPTS